MTVTLIITIITSIISFMAFSNQKLMNDLIFYPPAVANNNQWYRFFSCGLIHADFMHLLFNMFAFYMFGQLVEQAFQQIFPQTGIFLYIVLYVSSLAVSLIPTYMQHREDPYYRSLGASGAVSAVIFAGIFLFPTQGIGIMFIPIAIPGFIFGPLYLIISGLLNKKGGSNINHSAHIWGAVYGLVFTMVTSTVLSNYNLFENFMQQIRNYF
ncbi:MAG: rhomboid family intramembrane serine protease [Chitinophagaceae bacterium]